MNLGWKLVATVRQESGSDGALSNFALLDTYGSERHPIAAWMTRVDARADYDAAARAVRRGDPDAHS